MSAPGNPSWTRGPTARRRAGDAPHLRVSDAERAQAADRLSRHYADGRLDEATFNQRLDQAMNATTQADLSALFTDLPGPHAPPGTQAPAVAEHTGDRRARRPRLLLFALVIVIAAAAGPALAHAVLPWLLVSLLVLAWLRYGPRPRRRL
jgi:DUF1707 SHOCT-like domain